MKKWHEGPYIRVLLDGREKWGTFLSLTAVAGTLVFLADHPHSLARWLDLGPVVIGAAGSLFVFVVNCYYKQAKAIAIARETPGNEHQVKENEDARWLTFASRIGILGWMHVAVPAFLGGIASLALIYGLQEGPG